MIFPDLMSIFIVFYMKVRRIMVRKIHCYNDSIKTTDFRHNLFFLVFCKTTKFFQKQQKKSFIPCGKISFTFPKGIFCKMVFYYSEPQTLRLYVPVSITHLVCRAAMLAARTHINFIRCQRTKECQFLNFGRKTKNLAKSFG